MFSAIQKVDLLLSCAGIVMGTDEADILTHAAIELDVQSENLRSLEWIA